MKTNLWRVVYDERFTSSSGMQQYSTENTELTGYVLTRGDSLSSVRGELEDLCDSQSVITKIHSAHWLGKIMNTEL